MSSYAHDAVLISDKALSKGGRGKTALITVDFLTFYRTCLLELHLPFLVNGYLLNMRNTGD